MATGLRTQEIQRHVPEALFRPCPRSPSGSGAARALAGKRQGACERPVAKDESIGASRRLSFELPIELEATAPPEARGLTATRSG